MEIDTKIILNKASQSLRNLEEQLKHIKIVPYHSLVLKSCEFRTLEQFNSTVIIPNNIFPVVYTIEILDTKSKKALIEKFNIFNVLNKNKIKSIDRINHSKYNTNDSGILYVGSSINGFTGRLKVHLGLKKTVRTYGLHLSKWDEALNYSLHVSLYEIKYLSDKIPQKAIVELIEQQVWDQLQPVFGKRSGLL
jgi:hypothetical protein